MEDPLLPDVSSDQAGREDLNFSGQSGSLPNHVSPPKISTRTMTGMCHPVNKRAIDWSPLCGLLAYGCHGTVVVVDPITYKIVQCLDDQQHKSSVVRVAWTRTDCTSKHLADRLTLASADVSGKIIVWNAKSGEAKVRFQDSQVTGNRASAASRVVDMIWMDGSFDNCGHLLLTLHPPNILILWDTFTGTKVWRQNVSTTNGNVLLGFSFDPFDPSRLAFRSTGNSVVFLQDFQITKPPSGTGSQFRFFSSTHPVGNDTATNDEGKKGLGGQKTDRMLKMRNKMMELVTMVDNFSTGTGGGDTQSSECIQVLFHGACRNQLLVIFPREVLVFDVEIGQVVGIMGVDKGSPHIAQAFGCRQRDVVFLLHDTGVVSVRVRRKDYGIVNQTSDVSRSFSSSLTMDRASTPPSDNPSVDGNLHEIVYEHRAHSEPLKLGKDARMLGLSCHPIYENLVGVLSSDGKIVFLQLLPSNVVNNSCSQLCLKDAVRCYAEDKPPLDPAPLRLHTCGIMSPLGAAPFVVRMCPALTVKNFDDYKPLMAVGLPTGNVQVFNASTANLEREFATHTYPVGGIEWTGLHSLLSFAHQNLTAASSSSAIVRNELVHTDIRTGRFSTLRSHRTEEPPVDMIRVSHLKQYFIVAFVGAPFELWDLKNLTLLRIMPKKFPPVTSLDWSPLHNLKYLKKKEREKLEGKGDESSDCNHLVPKEHFVFTDPDGQLYHFTVEGNSLKEGTKLETRHGLGTVTCIVWKSNHIVRGDSEGNVYAWDIKTKSVKHVATKRGTVRKMRFAPGKGNMKLLVLHHDSVGIWDVKEGELINELRSPKDFASRPIDVDWAASDRPLIATADGCLRVMSLALSAATCSLLDYERDGETVVCLSLLPNKTRQNLEVVLQYQPWKPADGNFLTDVSQDDGFLPSELDLADVMLRQTREYERLSKSDETDAKAIVEKYLLAARLCGKKWIADFWEVALSVLFKDGLDPRFDLFCNNRQYLHRQMDRLSLYISRCSGSSSLRRRVVGYMICLGLSDKAVKLLLDTDPSEPTYYEDNLRACLVSSASGSKEVSDPDRTIKLVATSLIAEGKLWEGVQLLCLIGKLVEACQYLQSSNEWEASLWLAKCRLNGDENRENFDKIVGKYCDHFIGKGQLQKAVMVQLSVGDYVGVLDSLLGGKIVVLAAQFLFVVRERLKLLPDTSHVLVIVEQISLAFARHLFDCGNSRGAFYYCDKADEEGAILRKQFEILMSTSNNR